MRDRRVNPQLSGLITIAAVAVAVVGVVVSGLPSGPPIPLPWVHNTTIKARLADADALAPHSSVEIAGVKVGDVKSVEADGNLAVATLSIDSQYADIHKDARVLLRPHGLFGPKYIELDPGTQGQPPLSGDTISEAQSVQPVDLDQVLSVLQANERSQLKTAVIELGKAAAGRGEDVHQLVYSLDTLGTSLDVPATALDSVTPQLSDMVIQNESFNAEFARTPLDQLIANNNQVLAAFAQNSQHLQSLLVHADSAFTTLDAALAGQGQNLRSLIDQLSPTVTKLNQFNDLVSVFSANLTGKEPGYSDVVPGIIGAIENVRSATSSYDVCTTPGVPGSNCDAQGRSYYLQIQTFNFLPITFPSPGGPQSPGLPPPTALCGPLAPLAPVLGPVLQGIGCPAAQAGPNASHGGGASPLPTSPLGGLQHLLGT